MNHPVKVLISGGAGYIGSTVASRLRDEGFEVVVLDNLITGRREFVEGLTFYEGDIDDRALLDRIYEEHPDIAVVLHFAALIVVPDSVADPLGYYEANISKSLAFVRGLIANGCSQLVFSSSASIYAVSEDFSVDESSELAPTSPYARSKAMFEVMLQDIAAASDLNVLSLRYFNPIGSDPKFRTGLQIASPSHALGKLIEAHRGDTEFQITGTDYPTRDGSGIRDYVNVWDLAEAHVAAVREGAKIAADSAYQVINLGTGEGTTVRELVAAFESVVGESVRVVEAPRRPGDSAGAFTRSRKAAELLNWTASSSLEEGIASTLEWFERRKLILPDLAD